MSLVSPFFLEHGVDRGRRVMHEGMEHGPIQGQAHRHEPPKVGHSTIFKGYLLPHL